jgi:hypothetical protein
MLRSISVTLAANGATQIPCNATHLRCTSSSATFAIECYWKDELVFVASQFGAGLAFGPITRERFVQDATSQGGYDTEHVVQQFDAIRITNGATAQTIEIYYGDGEVQDNRLVGTVNITGALKVSVMGTDTFDSAGTITVAAAAAGTDTIIKVATTDGCEVILQNIGAFPVVLSQSPTTMTGTLVADIPGVVLEPVSGAGNVGGAVTFSGACIVRGKGVGGASNVKFHSMKET